MQDAQHSNVKPNWKLVSGTLMFAGDDLLRLYVPERLRVRIIREQHENLISDILAGKRCIMRCFYAGFGSVCKTVTDD
jgi:hypothetical protein